MTAELGTFWALVAIAGVWVLWALFTGARELWRGRKAPRWYDHTDGDYIDLRPRMVGRRKWL